MNSFKRVTALFLGLFFLLLGASCGKASDEPISEEELLEKLRQPTVMITVEDYRATGVIIGNDDDYLTIATVAHLMDGYDQGIITFYGGKSGFADVFYCDTGNDICLMRIKKQDMTPGFAESLNFAEFNEEAYDSLEKGDKIYVVGSTVGVAANATSGTFEEKDYYVPEFDRNCIYLYCDVFEGMSGSGVYTEDGYLIGLLTGGSDLREAVCIPMTDVIEEWRNYYDKN